MSQPEPNRDSKAFLSALAGELSTPPDELTAGRHVRAAVSAVRTAHGQRRSHAIHWAVVALAVTTVFGSGGIAVAGGLPGPLQTVVADVARALPVPVNIPYPRVSPDLVAQPEAIESDGDPDDAESQVDPHQPMEDESEAATTPTAPVEKQAVVMDDADAIEPGDEKHPDRTCDLRDDVADGVDEEEAEELRAEIRRLCDPDLVDPPRFTRDSSDDEDRSERRDHDRSNRHDDRDGASGDEGEDDRHQRDETDFGSSHSEHSDEPGDNESDEQEERHDDDEGDGQDQSSDGWRDRHD